ncbi:hypothetical protein CTI14_66750, partial [Methylobacterium radiotolerans]
GLIAAALLGDATRMSRNAASGVEDGRDMRAPGDQVAQVSGARRLALIQRNVRPHRRGPPR